VNPVEVLDLDTGKTIEYVGLTPAEALRNAYEQYGKKNWSTWTYKDPSEYPIKEGHYTLMLGSFSVVKAAAQLR